MSTGWPEQVETQPVVDETEETAVREKKSKKCAHPPCSCEAEKGKYCSVECEAMEKTPDLGCNCPHTVCKGHAIAARA
jgi:hypothetical protein